MFGVAITTSSICVGARCPHARAGVGAVATQNITDPHLATLVLDRLEAGDRATDALNAVTSGREHISYRQLTVVDKNGNRAHFTGENILGTNTISEGDDCVAAGNLLSSVEVPVAMAEKFSTCAELHLADRLLTALEAGIAAGGEEGPVHSAALYVAHEQPFALVDLRVDWEDNGKDGPVRKLREIWTAYEPQMNDYLTRALNPSDAPSYGVAGDP